MTAIKVSFNETAYDAAKKAVGGMRSVFQPTIAEDGTESASALSKATAAFLKAKAIADAEGVMTMRQDDELLSSEGMQPTVAIVGARERNDKTGKMDSGFRAVILFGMPDANAFITYEDSDGARVGADWVEKLIQKEAAHVFFRDLRNADTAEDLAAFFDSNPKDVAAFTARYAGMAEDTDAYDAIWPGFRKLLTAKLPALVKLLPGKGEVMKAIRSRAYAETEAELSPLEAQGIFKFLADSMIKAGQTATNDAGEPDPINTETIEAWLAERDTFTYREAPKAEKDFSVLSGLNLGILAAPAAAPATPAEPTGDESKTDEPEAPAAASGKAGKGK